MSASAEAVAAAAAACPGVVRLSPGTTVEVATYLPERRVHGVRMGDGFVDVHVIARFGTVLPALAEDIRRAVEPLAPDATIGIYVDDLELPDDPASTEEADGASPPPGA